MEENGLRFVPTTEGKMVIEFISDVTEHADGELPLDGSHAWSAVPPSTEASSKWEDRMKNIEVNHPLFHPIDRKLLKFNS